MTSERRANILLVDDLRENLLALEAVLQPLEQNLVRATSGDEALRLLLKDDYAVILLDVHMPGLDGFETAALIKQRERTRHVPIIFVTAISKDTEHVFRGYSEGAVDYLLKPYDPAVLRSKVSVFVQLFEKNAALEASEQRFRTAFANAPSGTALVKSDGKLMQVNAALATLLGRTEGELLEADWEEVLYPGDSGEDRLALADLAAGKRDEYRVQRKLLRPDGAELVVVISAAPISHPDPGSEQLIIQVEDVTERDRAEHERAERLRQQAARTEAEAVTRMVRSLQAVSDAALAHLALDDLLPQLVDRIREILGADNVSVLLCESDGDSLELRANSGVPGAPIGTRVPIGRGSFAGRVAKGRRSIAIGDLHGPEGAEVFEAELRDSGLRALIGVPLIAEGAVGGVLRAGSCTPNRFDEDEKALLLLMADRAALAIGNARLYEREHRVVETLQRSLLPARMPQLPGISIAARYRPGGADVGGDWYDAITLAEGAMGLVMGDVVGHGVDAAALMGELRNALRAYAVEDSSPETIVSRLDRMLKQVGDEQMATLLYGVIDPDNERMRYTSAGHPPPLLLDPDGNAEFLWEGRSTPLGVGGKVEYVAGEAELPAGSTLVLYTDGLVEVPGEPLDAGLARLKETVQGAGHDADRLCNRVMELLGESGSRDDVALLVVSTVALAPELRLEVPTTAASLRQGRRVLGRWLERVGAEPTAVRDIQLACHEACANAAEHARGDAQFHVEASHENGEVALVVRDSGSWREPLNGDRGHGLDLMKALMDTVKVDTGPDGTVVELRRRVGGLVASC